MIDINTKTLHFGNGDIMLGSYGNIMYFQGLKFSIEVGTCINNKIIEESNIERITDKFYIDFRDMQEILTLERLLKLVIDNNGENFVQFKFKDFTFDFSNYNEKSISKILYYLGSIRDALLTFTAC